MDKLVIEGGKALSGTIAIQGAKNAALPILAAAMLARGTIVIDHVPRLLDIEVMLDILRDLGCQAHHDGHTVVLDTSGADSSHVPERLMRQMRSSIFLMGPLLARFKKVEIYQPGGCAIGERKIDLHLRGLQALGAEIEESGNKMICRCDQLKGTELHLDFPSVGATENLMMAAVLAQGTTVLSGAAQEPEIEDLAGFLNAMGACVSGAGTGKIVIEGVEALKPSRYGVIPDRIVAGTIMVAAAATRGCVTLRNTNPSHVTALIHVLRRCGVEVETSGDLIKVGAVGRPRALDRIVTAPYPAFPTDLQSQVMVLLSTADGCSIVKETIFEGRLRHVDELIRMGADIQVDQSSAIIRGVSRLRGATVEATDLRAGAALVVAGLAAQGTTIVEHVYHIDRGYDGIERMFGRLGARISRFPELADSRAVIG
ncbi:UDP-N-acetylglucosamine 1-carboxyvinyltransferase [Paenibacillus sp. IB182496]|uniref:UDP-N-acetylglucosamine 1-carboxyvinyltransferase n=1 Tax=Paenibacillus sabuli TaxID=2772509 RepID=A0A927GT29_9BACL|nr:UDP-N-acetylglucosamine 1-carboxyvinyltransferase [Paenibacillus sabuli]MBD2846287.1 UDP-N-acetylglucosamine 1-carboxyvinyltransferase [Paenibacillus sabuli]